MRDCRCHRHVRSSRPLQPAKFILWLCSLSWIGLLSADEFPQTLPRTAEWTLEKPVDEVMLDGLHRYCLRALVDAREKRHADWLKTASNVRQRIEEQQARRDRFRKLIGAVDLRITESRAGQAADRAAVPGLLESDHYFEVITHPTESPMIARSANAVVYRVRWSVLDGVSAEGLMFVPNSIRAAVVAIPDADMNPEVFAGLSPHGDHTVSAGLVKSLVESGCLTIVPLLMSRSDEFSGRADIRMTNQPHREYVTRQAFEAGRHVIGYEVQKILAAVDLLEKEFVCHPNPLTSQNKPIGVIGIGEGGLLALYAAALDTRFQCCCVSGYFQTRENVWEEPIYRNVWKLLTEFGDAELGALICPRKLVIEACRISEVSGPRFLETGGLPQQPQEQ